MLDQPEYLHKHNNWSCSVFCPKIPQLRIPKQIWNNKIDVFNSKDLPFGKKDEIFSLKSRKFNTEGKNFNLQC